MNDNDEDEELKTFYGVVNVSHNGQIVIPARLRKDLNIKQGDQLVVVRSSDGEDILLVKMKKMDRILIESGFGLKKPY
jgi:AbrB family looped-hinge helix DNA binding protein